MDENPHTSPLAPASHEEEVWLDRMLHDWRSQSPVVQAFCLCVLRGDNTPEKVAFRLGLTVDQVMELPKPYGLLYSKPENELLFQ